MKKLLLIGLMLVFVVAIFADIQRPNSRQPIPMKERLVQSKTVRHNRETAPTPEWSFILNPETIDLTLYDYQFGSYDGTSVAYQSVGDAFYLTYMSQTTGNERHQSYAYVNSSTGDISTFTRMTNSTDNEGFGTVAIDQASGNPFIAWHSKYTGQNTETSVHIAIDAYSFYGQPGYPVPYQTIVNNSASTPHEKFYWPVVQVGDSPLADKKRVFVFCSNGGNRIADTNPSSNVLLAYADYDLSDLDTGEALNLTWNYIRFPYLELIHNNITSARAFPSYVVKDNYVVIGGFALCDSGLVDSTGTEIYPPHNMFYLISDNYGEPGSWDTETIVSERNLDAPMDQGHVPDTAIEGYTDFKISDSNCNHKSMYFDNLNRIHFTGCYSVGFNVSGEAKYWPKTQYIKDVSYDVVNRELSVYDLYPQGDFPKDNQLLIPWDFNEDGEVDSFYTNPDDPEDVNNGSWLFSETMIPMPYYDADSWFHYNYFRNTKTTADGWMAALWQDVSKSYAFNIDADDEYAQFQNVPETYICFSADNGNHWSSPIILNSIATPEFGDMIPTFFYLGDNIQKIDDDYGKVSMMFLDDNSFGSFVQAHGPNDGGYVKFAQLKVKFSDLVGNQDVPTNVKPAMLSQNYPNPFNPVTTIKFNMPKADKVNLSVYNVKGQLVKTLVNGIATAGNNEIRWTGVDNNNKSVSTGVYFYKLETSNHKEMKKMLLVK